MLFNDSINFIKKIYLNLKNGLIDLLEFEIKFIYEIVKNKENSNYIFILICFLIFIFLIGIKRKIKNIKKNKNFEKYLNDFKIGKRRLSNLNNKLNNNKISFETNYKIRIALRKYINIIFILGLFFSLIFNKSILNNEILIYMIVIIIIIICSINLGILLINFINKKNISKIENNIKKIIKEEKICIKTFLERIDNDFKNDLKKEIFKNYDLILDENFKEDNEFNDLYKKYLKQKIQLKTELEYNIAFRKFYDELSSFNWCDICYKEFNKKNKESKSTDIKNKDNDSCKQKCILNYLNLCIELDEELNQKIKKIENKYFISID